RDLYVTGVQTCALPILQENRNNDLDADAMPKFPDRREGQSEVEYSQEIEAYRRDYEKWEGDSDLEDVEANIALGSEKDKHKSGEFLLEKIMPIIKIYDKLRAAVLNRLDDNSVKISETYRYQPLATLLEGEIDL